MKNTYLVKLKKIMYLSGLYLIKITFKYLVFPVSILKDYKTYYNNN